jgi:hypothetical protein
MLQIPISPNPEDDFIAWHETKSYTFSVRSTYFTEWEHQYAGRLKRQDGQGTVNQNPT